MKRLSFKDEDRGLHRHTRTLDFSLFSLLPVTSAAVQTVVARNERNRGLQPLSGPWIPSKPIHSPGSVRTVAKQSKLVARALCTAVDGSHCSGTSKGCWQPRDGGSALFRTFVRSGRCLTYFRAAYTTRSRPLSGGNSYRAYHRTRRSNCDNRGSSAHRCSPAFSRLLTKCKLWRPKKSNRREKLKKETTLYDGIPRGAERNSGS